MRTIEEVLIEATNNTNKEFQDFDISSKSLDKVIQILEKYSLDTPAHNKARLNQIQNLIEQDAGIS